MKPKLSRKDHYAILKIAGIYAFFAAVWIYASDTVLAFFTHDSMLMVRIEILKGTLFVGMTAALLYRLISRYIRQSRQVEAELLANKKLVNALIDGSTDAMYVKDVAGRFLLFNSAASKVTGKMEEEVLGNDDTTLFPSNAMMIMMKDLQVMYSGQVQTYEEDVLTLDGTEKIFLSTKGPIYSDNGEVAGLFGIARDITKRKQMEKLLLESEERYRRLFEVESDAIFVVDCETNRFLDVNPAALSLYGYNKEDFLALTNSDVSAEPDKTRQAFAEQQTKIPLRWHRKKDGTVFPVEIAGSYFRDQGQPLHVAAIRDISDRVKAEMTLLETKERLNLALAASRTGVWEWDLNTETALCSPECLVILGIDSFGGTIKSFIEVMHQEDADRVMATINHAVEQREDYSSEFRIIRPDGQVRYVSHRGRPKQSDNNDHLKLVGTIQDITSRKETESREKAINALLSVFSKTNSRAAYCEAAIELVRQWSGCRCVGIRILDAHGNIPYAAYTGFSREFWDAENLLSTEKDACACIRVVTGKYEPQDLAVMTKGGSFYLNDTHSFVGGLSELEKARFRGVCLQYGFLSLALVPIHLRGKVIGAFHVADERKGQVSKDVVEFMEIIAPLVGEAIYRFSLEEELQQKYSELRRLSVHIQDAREDERRNITRELHDQLAQNLTVLGIDLNRLKTRMPARDQFLKIENSLILIEQMTESVRDLMAGLRPPLLDEYGLAAALRWDVEQLAARAGIDIVSEIHALNNKLDPRIENVLFRIAQEALNNIVKHAKARHAWLELEFEEERPLVRLTVSDDGIGFSINKPQEHIRNRGWGLITMAERAEGIGGTCQIESIPGKGTIVTAEVML
jgi:PAS domain S-box-containing protein